MRPYVPSRYGERQYASNKTKKIKALQLHEIGVHSPSGGLPPIMPKTKSQASLNVIRSNIKEMTKGGVHSIIENGRRESQ